MPDFDAPIPPEYAGRRLDRALAEMLPDYSRSRLQNWLAEGALTVDGETPAAKTKVAGGEQVRLCVPSEPDDDRVVAEPIALDIIHEDEAILVLDKPAGLVMHPGAGNPDGTLQNALIHHDESLAALPRAGIVHRLDKDTSGLMVAAKTDAAHRGLAKQFEDHSIDRAYLAVVWGVPRPTEGEVEGNIGRDPK